MAKIQIYGVSDDLIEIDGDLSEEFSVNIDGETGLVLAASDGTLLSIAYGGSGKTATWHIRRLVAGTASYSKKEATDEEENYTDRVTLEGDIKWVVCGEHCVRLRRAAS